jgi:hypothetical protein
MSVEYVVLICRLFTYTDPAPTTPANANTTEWKQNTYSPNEKQDTYVHRTRLVIIRSAGEGGFGEVLHDVFNFDLPYKTTPPSFRQKYQSRIPPPVGALMTYIWGKSASKLVRKID